eukprot:650402-Prymnesium_polylepis.1
MKQSSHAPDHCPGTACGLDCRCCGRLDPVGSCVDGCPCRRPWLARRARVNARPSGANDVARRARVDVSSSDVAPSGRTKDVVARGYERITRGCGCAWRRGRRSRSCRRSGARITMVLEMTVQTPD